MPLYTVKKITITKTANTVTMPESIANRPKFEGAIFDLDGVITDTAHYHYLAWKSIADEEGIDFDEKNQPTLKRRKQTKKP